MRPGQLGALLLLGLVAGSPGCNDLWGINKRKLDPHLICSDTGCSCAEGFDDCDGDPDNGCEADLGQNSSCGECGRACGNGQCMDGACACSAGFDDCDGDPDNGCEAALGKDAANCGRCGRDCLGAACETGRCRSVVLLENDFQDAYYAGPTLHEGHAYIGMCMAPTILRVPLQGGAPEPVIQESGCAYAILIEGDQMYWQNSGQILVVPLDGLSAPTVLVSNLSFPGALCLGGGWIYWTEYVGASLLFRASPSPGAAPEQIGPVGQFASIHATRADTVRLYVGTSQGVYALPHTESTPFELAPGKAEHLALDATHIYWTDTNVAEIRRMPTTGGAPQTVAPGIDPGPLAVDGSFVYWLDRALGAIHRTPLDGQGESAVITDDVAIDTRAIAVDAEAVYWLTPQQLLKVAK